MEVVIIFVQLVTMEIRLAGLVSLAINSVIAVLDQQIVTVFFVKPMLSL